MKKSQKIAHGGIAAALSAVMLILTSYTVYGCYAAAAAAGLVCLCFSYCIGKRFALIAYAAGGIVALLLSSDKSGVFLYLIFAGWYPIAKIYISDIKSFVLKIIIKIFIVLFTGVLCTIMLMVFIGVPDMLSGISGTAVTFIIGAGFVCAFSAYDIALTVFEKRYKVWIISLMKKLLK